MDIMNELPPAHYADIDDLLAFISIYDDDNRTHAYFDLLSQHADVIRNKTCMEAGCGFGLMAEYMAKHGAKKVYAVESNPQLYDIAKKRLAPYATITVVHSDVRDFSPPEQIDLLVHEFFGQLLFDEDIFVLNELRFSPKMIMPNRAQLKMSLYSRDSVVDDVVTTQVLDKLTGTLVSGLFDAENVELTELVLEWQPGQKELKKSVDLTTAGDVLCFGLEVFHNDQFICRAGECDNWSLVWTPRAGDRFVLEFEPASRGTHVHFQWIT